MTSHAWVLAVVTSLAAAAGCRSTCDDDELQHVAQAFDARVPASTAAGFDELWRACPSMPLGLARSLAAEFDPARVLTGEDLDEHHDERVDDPQWRALFHHTCPEGEPRDLDDVEGLRRACLPGPHDLLGSDDVFIARDVPPLMFYDWLLSAHVPRPLAQDVVRPLLAASEPLERLAAMCWDEGIACRHVTASLGISVPEAILARPGVGEGPRIVVTSDRITVEGERVAALEQGRLASSERSGHAIPRLRRRLAPSVSPPAESKHPLRWPIARVTVVADGNTPTETLVDVLFTAAKAGYGAADLVVAKGGRLQIVPVAFPRTWLPVYATDERNPSFRVELRHDVAVVTAPRAKTKVLPLREGCEPSSLGCYDLEGLASAAGEHAKYLPRALSFDAGVEDDVPFQTALTVFSEIYRGYGCLDAKPPARCGSVTVTLDAIVPRFEHSDGMASPVLGEVRVEPLRDEPDPSVEPSLRQAYARGREPLTRCLVQWPHVLERSNQGYRMNLEILRPPQGQSGWRAHRPQAPHEREPEIDACIMGALGLEYEAPTVQVEFYERRVASLVVPVRYEPKPSPAPGDR